MPKNFIDDSSFRMLQSGTDIARIACTVTGDRTRQLVSTDSMMPTTKGPVYHANP